ncbi:DUF5602 domain-containing protein [Cyclobacterium jeungdonense]|uniref:DUF5602 domain-containing protein n=1 Tax=Cyclobacterium jeungdonense TaxID=708087 RepID=A0ABT8C3B0_9BACT|nr:DUF5602 domain-containing protein [Cyclobacterium jeungdonense]MDN3687265.1 DUF5602 domain-containing protein [Cyclobacterium jeungdonense]
MKTFEKTTLLQTVIKSLIIMMVASSCELLTEDDPLIVKNKKTAETTYYGPAVAMGNGKAQTFITINKGGSPTAMGVALNEKALENLPSGDEGTHPGVSHARSFESILQFPKQAEITPYKFMTIDWAPEGHEPEGIYNLPHFDFHFYMISNEERLTITPFDGMDPEIPQAKYMPAPYIQLPGRVPNMGVHWADPTSPELGGETFTRTFIYGSFKEKVIFMEPMITLDYIKSKPTAVNDLKLPTHYQVNGFYPSKYEVKYNSVRKEYLIMFSDFNLKMADQ